MVVRERRVKTLNPGGALNRKNSLRSLKPEIPAQNNLETQPTEHWGSALVPLQSGEEI